MLYVLGVLLVLAVIFFVLKIKAPLEIYSRFGVNAASHKLLSTDLGKADGRIKLARFGINGIPDAVFEALSGKLILAGEFKSRKYRGVVKLYELYQLMLYMGHLQDRYPNHTIVGCLAYADERVKVRFDPALYQALIELRNEYWQTIKRRKPVNPVPLHKRMKVNAGNLSMRLTSKM
uniref:hypothetical protein n=1 Tax=Pseudomonas fluorescens TaxID=294 RepID=UPI001868CB45|nr:hypothetical protein [Pseudomonas fluorescens]